MNHKVLQADWNLSQKHLMECFQHFCCICVGINNSTTSKALSTVASRALKSAAYSWMHWKNSMADSCIKMADALNYLYSSDVLWNNGKYGNSIYILQHWLRPVYVETGSFHIIREEFQKIPMLLQERIHTNSGAYFDKICSPEAVPSIEDIIRS